MGIRFAILKFLPFLNRWMEVTPCCGTCPTCGVVGVTGITAQFVGVLRADKPASPDDGGSNDHPLEADRPR
jgi:hypothetical protein